MTFSLLPTLSESRLYPSERHLRRITTREAADLVLLHIISLRILLAEQETEQWARDYARKTSATSSFVKWRPDGTDLYALLYGLLAAKNPLEDGDDSYRTDLPLDPGAILRWLRAEAQGAGEERRTRALVNRIDQMLRIRNSSMKALRRMVLDWPDLNKHERELTVTRLLQFFRDRAPTGEILPNLTKLARHHGWEIDGACNLEAGEDCGDEDSRNGQHPHKEPEKRKGLSFMAGLAAFGVGYAGASALSRRKKTESASAGATSSGNVATVVGGLGAGFDGDYSRSIYGTPKKPKKDPAVIRRGEPPKAE